ncbi:hypothetical protein EXIGLDRAFT_463893 [Exidia glandulosa HHB12029]|uniref:Uncharacterized protein n=1 Tax=Exidia glandulosa HHB12029 TaxID=1314781 RepID=A0A165AZ05_EXIGL|nr:hypothetical protein EXIGLDRAFT_463893 [Exidia glandulosa HHB12029]
MRCQGSRRARNTAAALGTSLKTMKRKGVHLYFPMRPSSRTPALASNEGAPPCGPKPRWTDRQTARGAATIHLAGCRSHGVLGAGWKLEKPERGTPMPKSEVDTCQTTGLRGIVRDAKFASCMITCLERRLRTKYVRRGTCLRQSVIDSIRYFC